jgi:hypothetical protein
MDEVLAKLIGSAAIRPKRGWTAPTRIVSRLYRVLAVVTRSRESIFSTEMNGYRWRGKAEALLPCPWQGKDRPAEGDRSTSDSGWEIWLPDCIALILAPDSG